MQEIVAHLRNRENCIQRLHLFILMQLSQLNKIPYIMLLKRTLNEREDFVYHPFCSTLDTPEEMCSFVSHIAFILKNNFYKIASIFNPNLHVESDKVQKSKNLFDILVHARDFYNPIFDDLILLGSNPSFNNYSANPVINTQPR